jgi:serine/threonine protein kinase
MTTEQWQELRELFEAAVPLSSPERRRMVDELRHRDPLMADELATLLAAEERHDVVLESPAASLLELALAHRDRPLEAPSLAPGAVLGDRYEIGEFLGEGGFGRVYSAFDRRLANRKMVVKVLKLSLGDALEKRFQQEITALSRLDHPGIVSVTDSGRLPDGAAYLVMQYVPGASLHNLIAQAAIPFERGVRLLRDIAEALATAHQAGVLHRDLKPSNVIVRDPGGPDERAVLIDFGIARSDATGLEQQTTIVAGSPPYMAPEQLLGRTSQASDVYSLGTIAFEIFVGKRLLDCAGVESPRDSVEKALQTVVPALPAGLTSVILQSVVIDSQNRIRSVTEFQKALGKLPKPAGRRWLLVAAAVSAAALAAYSWRAERAYLPVPPPSSPPVNHLHVSLRRNTRAAGKAPELLAPNDPLRAGDQLEVLIQSPLKGFVYAFDESRPAGKAKPNFTLLFPGAGGDPQTADAVQRIPNSPAAWLEFDGAPGSEAIWLVWSPTALDTLERIRRYSASPDYGALPQSEAGVLAPWLVQHQQKSPTAEPVNGGLEWPQNGDALTVHIFLTGAR